MCFKVVKDSSLMGPDYILYVMLLDTQPPRNVAIHEPIYLIKVVHLYRTVFQVRNDGENSNPLNQDSMTEQRSDDCINETHFLSN